MSSRVLRKLGLQGDKELTCLGDDGSDTEADFSSSGGAKKKQLNVNRYDLLNQQSHSESEVKEDDDHETASSLNAQEGAIDIKDATRRKRKKRKKKQAGKFPSNARSSEDNIEDEVERSVREVNEILGEMSEVGPGGKQSSASEPAPFRGVLTVDHRALNPHTELRRLCGVKLEVKKRGRNRGHMKSTWLVTPKENWPQVGKPGLSMRLVETKNGINYFCYEHSVNYQQVQLRFLEAVESLNPDNIVAIINTQPYHVDALLQLSALCRLSEDLAMAAELVERALYCLECAFHPSFSLSAGNARLDYRNQENRALYIAMFKHMLYVGSRACYRTALEFCKLILSLDPDGDPLAVLLAIDFYALRSQEYEWLIRISREWEASRNLSQLPNFAYSVALAHFQLGEMETADAALQKAILMFPGVLQPLMEKCGTSLDEKITSAAYFNNATSLQSKSLTQLEILYAHRACSVWKEGGEAIRWLERNVNSALGRIEGGGEGSTLAEWVTYRTRWYPSTPRNVHRHIILTDIKDVPTIFNEDSPVPVFSFDPLPPLDSINIYARPPRFWAYDNYNTLSLFFRSLMPNFTWNQVPSDDAGGGGEEGGAGVELRRSMASLIDAMRDLLSNIHMPDVDGDVEDSDDGAPWYGSSNFRV